MSDPTTSGAGSNNPKLSAFGNPDDFTSQYDRNWIAMASALFSESYFSETGHHYDTGVQRFWEENCEAPAIKRSAVPRTLWRMDPKVYGEEDIFSHDVPVWSFAPLRAFGSLRQLRDLATGGSGNGYSEDYTNMADTDQFKTDRDNRATNSLHELYRERICNPTYKYSINDAIGNPPIGSNNMQGGVTGSDFIRDASTAKLPRYDMWVPNGMLGASGIRRPHPEGCGLGIESGGCNPAKAPTYYDSSLWSWAYVTSSDDPDVAPGWHRLLYLKAFTVSACSANKAQTCKSEINRATVGENFDFATLVAAEFKREQEDRLKNAMATSLAQRQSQAVSEDPEEQERSRSRYSGRMLAQRRTAEDGPHRAISEHARRALFVSPDGVYDLDAMITATQADGDMLEVTDRYWGLSREEALLRFDLIRQKLKPDYITFMINSGNGDAIPSSYRTGQAALYASRCSDLLKKTFPDDENVHCCLVAPSGQSCNPEHTYSSRPECNQGPLELADTNEETLGEEYLARLLGMSPPPSPPPSPSPPPPPSPPAPPPPPAPPIAITADQGKAMALIAQRQFCDSVRKQATSNPYMSTHYMCHLAAQVYFLSAEARCSRLATAMMTAFVLGDGFSPPPLPPLPKNVPPPPPPPPPPRPRIPAAEEGRVVFQDPLAVTLSTYFIGDVETDPSTASTATGNSMTRLNMANATREQAFQDITWTVGQQQWAACSEALTGSTAVLPCRSGDFPQRCINGARHCGTAWENTHEPWIEIDLRDGKPDDRDYYFFALYVMLPTEPEYGSLFFASGQGVSEDRGDVTNRFYKLEVFDESHNPLPTQCKPYHRQSTDFYTVGMAYFQYVCLEALAEDVEYENMRHVRFVRLTLLGEYRTIWLTGLRAEWRSLEELPPALPPPPPSPPLPPMPVAPPDQPPFLYACHTYQDVGFGNAYPVAFEEPCGLTAEACCRLAYDHDHTAAFHLSPSGCCTLLNVPEADQASMTTQALQPAVIRNDALSPVVASSGMRQALPATYLVGG